MGWSGQLLSWLRDLRHRVGRRGAFLGFLAVLDYIFGYFLLYPPSTSPPQPFPLFPSWAWAACWLAVGAACMVSMFLAVDRVAYGLAALLMAAWGLRYVYLWYTGTPYAWVSAAIWLVFAGIVVVIAGWPEEVSLPPETRDHVSRPDH